MIKVCCELFGFLNMQTNNIGCKRGHLKKTLYELLDPIVYSKTDEFKKEMVELSMTDVLINTLDDCDLGLLRKSYVLKMFRNAVKE